MTAQRRHELTDEEWRRVEKYFPQRQPGQLGRPRNEDRQMLNGILWIVRTGAPWRDLPEQYGAWSSVYNRFAQWQKSGLFQTILAELGVEADLQDMSMDSSSSHAHQHSAGAKKEAVNSDVNQHIGISRGGKTTKIHVIVDALGNPIHIHLSAGNLHDSTEAETALSDVPLEGTVVLADKAYNSKAIRDSIVNRGATYCIPPKSNDKHPWDYDKFLYKERHLVECFFQKIQQFRGVATRYNKLACRFLACVQLAAVMIWLA
jgi:transposase